MNLDTIMLNDENPRTITKEAFQKLCKSIQRDPQFMPLRPIVINDQNVVIGGNQRYRACRSLGLTEVPDSWVMKASNLTPEQIKRFIVIDNSPDGMSGEWDWDQLGNMFTADEADALGLQVKYPPDYFKLKECNEDNAKLKEWIAKRKESNKRIADAQEVNFWLCLVFQSYEQKMAFLKQLPELETRYGMYVDAELFCAHVGIQIEPAEQTRIVNAPIKHLAEMSLPNQSGETDSQ